MGKETLVLVTETVCTCLWLEVMMVEEVLSVRIKVRRCNIEKSSAKGAQVARFYTNVEG